jgi:hypothetical protein
MTRRASLIGACVGALVGAGGRAGVAACSLNEASQGGAVLVLTAALIGMVLGAFAGATGRPVLGALVGAGLSGLFFLMSFPVVAVFDFLGALRTPSLLLMVAMGALAGGVGGAAARRQVGRADHLVRE